MKKLLILLFVISSFAFATDAKKAGFVGIDVRSLPERTWNPAPGSVAISNSDLKDDAIKKVPNKETKIKVFCEAGVRAERAKQILNELGYKNVENINSWREWNKLKK